MESNCYRELIHRLNYTVHLHSYHIINSFNGNEIYRGQPPMLRYLIEHEDCSQKELADFMHVSPASVAVSVKRMCKAGLVEKAQSGEDARVNRLHVTPKGDEIMKKCQKEFESIDKRMFAGISESELNEFNRLLGIMIHNLAGEALNEKDVFNFIKSKKRDGD